MNKERRIVVHGSSERVGGYNSGNNVKRTNSGDHIVGANGKVQSTILVSNDIINPCK